MQPPAYCRLQVRLMLRKTRACVRTWGHGIDTIGIRTRKIPATRPGRTTSMIQVSQMGQDSDGAAAAGGAGIQSSGISGSGASDHTTGNFNELRTHSGPRAASKLSIEAQPVRGWLSWARCAGCTKRQRKKTGGVSRPGGPLRPPSRAECHQWGRARALVPAAST